MPITKNKPGHFKKISQREVEWSSKKENFPALKNFKEISERKVEWNNSSAIKDFLRFLSKANSSKKPLSYIYRFTKYKFFTELSKQFPKSSLLINRVFEKYPHNIKLMYSPGLFLVGPFLIANKFQVTEKILLELNKRKIGVAKIVENEKITMSILSKNFIFINDLDNSKRFKKYIDFLEKEIMR